MSRQCISNLVPGMQVDDQVFRIAQKDLRQTTQGSLYIHAILADATGQIPARMWQASESFYNAMPLGGYIKLKGRVESYKGMLQFIIEALRPVNPDEIDLSEFLPHTDKNIDEMLQRVKAILAQITHPDIKTLIDSFVSDEELMKKFCRAPAAMAMHQAWIGGLIEHTLNVMELAELVIPRYPELSLDLVRAGIFLHDLGKTEELTYEASIGYSDEGQLVGHLVQCAIWIDQKCRDISSASGKPFPDEIRMALQHIVISHHGTYEYGSPKIPAMPEAIAIHYLDNIDAKIFMFTREIKDEKDPTARWTNYSRALETKIWRHDPTGTRKL